MRRETRKRQQLFYSVKILLDAKVENGMDGWWLFGNERT